ncbi:MAG: HD domain-containing protein [Thermodesulfobacteriota bacterium]|nr:HD domain-containing protein [Thermodesulfobacteriota bacterium]
MNKIAELFFEAKTLKELPRSGYQFLGSGKESVAEHSFMVSFICLTISRMEPDLDAEKLISMALIHDLPEARTGDLNYVQKKYVRAREDKAIADMTEGLTFGREFAELMEEFNRGETREARLANDADQLSFILELKKLMDTGAKAPEKWLPIVINRLKTELGKQLAQSIVDSNWDDWWLNGYSEPGIP